jgi:uncharacterized membrane protein
VLGSLGCEPIFQSYTTVAAIVVVAAVLVVRWNPTSGSNPDARQQRWLRALRLLGLAWLLLGMLRPTWTRTDQRPLPATLAVLVDTSASAQFPSADGKRSRWLVQREAYDQLRSGLQGIDEALELQTFRYDASLARISDQELQQRWLNPPNGKSTDVGGALASLLAQQGDRPLAGVVLMGDGTSTMGEGPLPTARAMASLQLPLWTVPLGARVGSETRDASVNDAPELLTVFAKNRFSIRPSIRLTGFAGIEVPVQLRLLEENGSERELLAQTMVVSGGDQTESPELETSIEKPGRYRLIIEVPPQAGESITLNNRQVTFLEVRDGGGRILYLEGEPRTEQIFLRRALESSGDLQVGFAWIEATPQQWPAPLGDALTQRPFDVCILGDLDSAAIGTQQLKLIADAVSSGKGLLLLGGLQAFDSGGYANTPLADAIPLRMDAARRQPVGGPLREDLQLPGPLQMIPARSHPILRIASDPTLDVEAWRKLMPLLGANRWLEPKVLPSVEVLATSSDGKTPLLVSGQFGKGRVLAFAGDSTWQWARRPESKETHRRFWRQAVLWLLGREDPAGQLWLRLPKRRFRLDEPIDVTAGVNQAQPSPTAIRLQGNLILADQSARPIELAPQASQWQTTLSGLPAGVHRIRVEGGPELTSAEIEFEVLNDDREQLRPFADVALMEQIAAITKEAGGRAVLPDDMASLAAQIRDLRATAKAPVIERYRFGDGPWSGSMLMLLFVATLTTEWIARKRLGLP